MPDDATITSLIRLAAAGLIGALIGLERTYHGRPAGFRTHILVCAASTALMLVSVYQVELLPALPAGSVRIDPMRMAQGVMTGIGFLGAGVIMKEGLDVHGLTTAASIWITAAIGILVGIGFYSAAVLATLLVLGTLSVFRALEIRMPSLSYARLAVRFSRQDYLSQDALGELIAQFDATGNGITCRLVEEGRFLEYELTLCSTSREHFRRLAETLAGMEKVLEFSLTPKGEK